MTHLMEPVSQLSSVSEDVHDEHCVFCKKAEVKGEESNIGKDNNSTTLGDNLKAAGVKPPRFERDPPGVFSAEAHHLLPGKEALDGHALEMWLSTKATKGTKVEADTGFDINSHLNGEWLPSIPDTLKGAWSWRNAEHMEMAIAIMKKVSLQFHKGPHDNKGGLDKANSEPLRNYIKMVEMRMDALDEHAAEWRVLCPEVKDKNGKVPPPRYMNDLIYGYVSSSMRGQISGHPKSWKVFISRVAFAAQLNVQGESVESILSRLRS